MPSLRLAVAAGRGPLTVLAEVGDLVPGLRLVQFHRARGDSIDFFQFYGALLPLVRMVHKSCKPFWRLFQLYGALLPPRAQIRLSTSHSRLYFAPSPA